MKVKRLRADVAVQQTRATAHVGANVGARRAAGSAALAKAKGAGERVVRPQLARAELLDKATRVRFEEEIDAALKRRPNGEAKLAGALRAVAPLSPALRASLGEATAVLLRRGALQRELYGCGLRALAEAQDRQSVSLLRQALVERGGGGPGRAQRGVLLERPRACGAARQGRREPAVAPGVRRRARAGGARRVERGPARAARADDQGEPSHLDVRRALCSARSRSSRAAPGAPVGRNVGPALAMLRGAERHLGRWLVLAEVAVKAGDVTPLEEARARASSGPPSSQAAWSLVAWALSETDAVVQGRRGAAAASDAADARARRAPLRSAERGPRHDVPLPHGQGRGARHAPDARGVRAHASAGGRDGAPRGALPRARPRPGRPAGVAERGRRSVQA